jgi:molybdopterin-binding protein
VKTFKKGPVNTDLVVILAGGSDLVPGIAPSSVERLGQKVGATCDAVIKASGVMIGID